MRRCEARSMGKLADKWPDACRFGNSHDTVGKHGPNTCENRNREIRETSPLVAEGRTLVRCHGCDSCRRRDQLARSAPGPGTDA